MSKSIVQSSDDHSKTPRTRFVGPLRPASPSILARLLAIEFGDKDAFDGIDPIDDPVLDHLEPAQISAFYRSRMDLFEPAPAASVEAA